MICVLVLMVLCSCGRVQTPSSVIYENSSVAEQKNRYLIFYSISLVSNDSVGSQWITGVKHGNREIVSGKELVFEGEQLEFLLYAIEKDGKLDDIGEESAVFSKIEIGEEETIEEIVEVEENGGAYRGSVAVWQFTVTVKRLS